MDAFLKKAEDILFSASQSDGSEQMFGYLDVPSAITNSVDAIRFLYRKFYEYRIKSIPERFQRKEYWEEFVRDFEMRIAAVQKQIAEQDPYPASSKRSGENSALRTQLQYRQRGKGLKRRGTR